MHRKTRSPDSRAARGFLGSVTFPQDLEKGRKKADGQGMTGLVKAAPRQASA